VQTYNPSADAVLGQTPDSTARKFEVEPAKEAPASGEEKKEKKKKKRAEEETTVPGDRNGTAEQDGEGEAKKEKKKKKKHQAENDGVQNEAENVEGGKKKKKRKHSEAEQDEESEMPSKKKEKKEEEEEWGLRKSRKLRMTPQFWRRETSEG
jgi:nucleolar protein 58